MPPAWKSLTTCWRKRQRRALEKARMGDGNPDTRKSAARYDYRASFAIARGSKDKLLPVLETHRGYKPLRHGGRRRGRPPDVLPPQARGLPSKGWIPAFRDIVRQEPQSVRDKRKKLVLSWKTKYKEALRSVSVRKTLKGVLFLSRTWYGSMERYIKYLPNTGWMVVTETPSLHVAKRILDICLRVPNSLIFSKEKVNHLRVELVSAIRQRSTRLRNGVRR